MANFGDLKTKAGQQALNTFLADKSYLAGYTPSALDFTSFDAMGTAPSGMLNWHIENFDL